MLIQSYFVTSVLTLLLSNCQAEEKPEIDFGNEVKDKFTTDKYDIDEVTVTSESLDDVTDNRYFMNSEDFDDGVGTGKLSTETDTQDGSASQKDAAESSTVTPQFSITNMPNTTTLPIPSILNQPSTTPDSTLSFTTPPPHYLTGNNGSAGASITTSTTTTSRPRIRPSSFYSPLKHERYYNRFLNYGRRIEKPGAEIENEIIQSKVNTLGAILKLHINKLRQVNSNAKFNADLVISLQGDFRLCHI